MYIDDQPGLQYRRQLQARPCSSTRASTRSVSVKPTTWPGRAAVDVPSGPSSTLLRRVQEVLTRSLRGFAVAPSPADRARCAAPASASRRLRCGGLSLCERRRDAGEEDCSSPRVLRGRHARGRVLLRVLEGPKRPVRPTTARAPRSSMTSRDLLGVRRQLHRGALCALRHGGVQAVRGQLPYRNIQSDLVARALAPWNWPRLLRSDVIRIESPSIVLTRWCSITPFATLPQPAPHRRPYLLRTPPT